MGVIFTAQTDFFHGTAECLHFRIKADTANRGAARQTYLVVLDATKNLGTDAESAPFTLSEFAVASQKKSAPVLKC